MDLHGWSILLTMYCINHLVVAGLFWFLITERRRDKKELVKAHGIIFEIFRAEMSKQDARQLVINQIEKLQERAKR